MEANIRMNKKQLKFRFLMNLDLLGNIFCFKYRHVSFVLCIIVLCRYGMFYTLQVCGHPVSSISICTIFPAAFVMVI